MHPVLENGSFVPEIESHHYGDSEPAFRSKRSIILDYKQKMMKIYGYRFVSGYDRYDTFENITWCDGADDELAAGILERIFLDGNFGVERSVTEGVKRNIDNIVFYVYEWGIRCYQGRLRIVMV